MLALVKTPRTETPTEISINGPLAKSILEDLRKDGYLLEYPFSDDVDDDDEEYVDIDSCDWFQEMNENRVGNLLAGYRLREELTQKHLAEKSGIAQPVISAYERGKRPISRKAAMALAKVLNIRPEAILQE